MRIHPRYPRRLWTSESICRIIEPQSLADNRGRDCEWTKRVKNQREYMSEAPSSRTRKNERMWAIGPYSGNSRRDDIEEQWDGCDGSILQYAQIGEMLPARRNYPSSNLCRPSYVPESFDAPFTFSSLLMARLLLADATEIDAKHAMIRQHLQMFNIFLLQREKLYRKSDILSKMAEIEAVRETVGRVYKRLNDHEFFNILNFIKTDADNRSKVLSSFSFYPILSAGLAILTFIILIGIFSLDPTFGVLGAIVVYLLVELLIRQPQQTRLLEGPLWISGLSGWYFQTTKTMGRVVKCLQKERVISDELLDLLGETLLVPVIEEGIALEEKGIRRSKNTTREPDDEKLQAAMETLLENESDDDEEEDDEEGEERAKRA